MSMLFSYIFIYRIDITMMDFELFKLSTSGNIDNHQWHWHLVTDIFNDSIIINCLNRKSKSHQIGNIITLICYWMHFIYCLQLQKIRFVSIRTEIIRGIHLSGQNCFANNVTYVIIANKLWHQYKVLASRISEMTIWRDVLIVIRKLVDVG
jgi:hypothetical protein